MFITADLENMRNCNVQHCMDECHLQTCVETGDSFNELVQTWPADGDALKCGLDMRPGSERHGVDKTILSYDATIRLPITSAPAAKDRIKVTKRHGEALGAALVYDIVGTIQKGPSGVRLLLKTIET